MLLLIHPPIGIRAKFSQGEALQLGEKYLEMEVYKLGKIIENQEIEIHLILHSLEEAREELRKSLKRRREIAIAENDTQYKEIDTSKVFSNGDTKYFDVAIEDVMEKNRDQVEEIRSLKIEKES